MNSFARQHARFFVSAGAFSLVLNLALLAPSLYMLQVFDRVLATRSVETLTMLSLITGGALLLMFVLDLVRARPLALAGSLFEALVGAQVLRRLLDGVGRAMPAQHAHALRDVSVLRGAIAGPGVVSLFDAPWMLIYIGVIFLFNELLGMLALGSACLLVLLAWITERSTRSGIEQTQELSREGGRFVDLVLRNSEVVRAMGMAPAVVSRWEASVRDVQQRLLDTQRLSGVAGSLTRCFRQSVQVVMMGVAAWLVIEQKATPGVMIAATVILGRALAPVEMLIAQWKSIVEARAAWRRLKAFVGPIEAARFSALPQPSGAIELKNVSYVPPGSNRPIVRGVSLEIARGEVLAVLGPSGSGKSTLVRLLLGIVPATAGSVRIDGAEVSQWDPAALGVHIGYLPQDVGLFHGTVADNIARLGNPNSPDVVEAAKLARAHDLIVRLNQGYDTQVGEAGQWLSGGQRQRVALARALYGKPKLVVLDEPNANLDSEGEQALKDAVEELRQAGVTVVVVTQRTQILPVADRMVVMRDGVIERIGVRQDKSSGAAEAAEAAEDANQTVPVLHQAR